MEDQYNGWRYIELKNERYYFNWKTQSFAKEMDGCCLVEITDSKIISELEKKVGLAKKPIELRKNYELMASSN